jgi:hypothetical protein
MPDIEPEEVDGLQNYVSILKSIKNRYKLTINENPQTEYEWTLNDCLNRSRSFSVFFFAVHPDYLDKLLPLCLELDYFLHKSSINNCLIFNTEKHGKKIIYQKLYVIWCQCFASYTESKWFYNFIAENTNLAYNGDAVRKAFERNG